MDIGEIRNFPGTAPTNALAACVMNVVMVHECMHYTSVAVATVAAAAGLQRPSAGARG